MVVTKRHAGTGIVHGLGMQGVPIILVAYGPTELSSSRYVQETLYLPHPQAEAEEFIAGLFRIAAKYGGNLLCPASDEALATISRYKPALAQYYLVGCTDWEISRLYIDKSHTYDLAYQYGIPAPRSMSPTSEEEAEAFAREIGFPCLIKPKQVHLFHHRFRKKMFLSHTADEVISGYRKAHEAGLEVMVQEFIPGSDAANVNYNSYRWPGQPTVEFTAEKVRNAPPQVGSPRVVISKHLPEILDSGRAILSALGYYGFSCVELKRDDRDGIYKLMEVNGRHNRSAMLAIRCGINFPWIEYAHRVLGEQPAPADFLDNVYWIDLLADIKNSVKYFRQEHYSPLAYLRPYVSKHVFALFDLHNPALFLRHVWMTLNKSKYRSRPHSSEYTNNMRGTH